MPELLFQAKVAKYQILINYQIINWIFSDPTEKNVTHGPRAHLCNQLQGATILLYRLESATT